MTTAEDARSELVSVLAKAGSLRTEPWRHAFTAVPRETFLPRFLRQGGDTRWEAIDATHPDWLTLVYEDRTWVTQLNNDPAAWTTARLSGPIPGYPTSSSTQPSLMVHMLEALDVEPGHRVLELGTGTGYNAALLSEFLGGDHVVSVEYDAVVAADARAALNRTGHIPILHIGDGAVGSPEDAPFDRVMATYGPIGISPAWITQTRPGGKILSHLYRDIGGGALVLLTVHGDHTATGHFLHQYGGFMATREHTGPRAQELLDHAAETAAGSPRATPTDAAMLWDDDFGMLAALALPHVTTVELSGEAGDETWLLAGDGSVARLTADGSVAEQGPRKLWAIVESLHAQWRALGQPTRNRFGLTVLADGEHRFWLDEPGAPVHLP